MAYHKFRSESSLSQNSGDIDHEIGCQNKVIARLLARGSGRLRTGIGSETSQSSHLQGTNRKHSTSTQTDQRH